jgi:hypothetical protein
MTICSPNTKILLYTFGDDWRRLLPAHPTSPFSFSKLK